MFEQNEKVICYYDSVITTVKGTIAGYKIDKYGNNKMFFYKVKWDNGGCSYFPECCIFKTNEEHSEYVKKKDAVYQKSRKICKNCIKYDTAISYCNSLDRNVKEEDYCSFEFCFKY